MDGWFRPCRDPVLGFCEYRIEVAKLVGVAPILNFLIKTDQVVDKQGETVGHHIIFETLLVRTVNGNPCS